MDEEIIFEVGSEEEVLFEFPEEASVPTPSVENSIIVSSSVGTWLLKSLAQFKAILGLGSAAYTASSAYLPSNISIPSKTSELSNDSGYITSDYVPDQLSELQDDSTHRTVTDTEKGIWNNKSKITQVTSLSLVAASWTTGATYWQYELSHASILSTSIVDIIPDNADNAVVSAAQILPATISAEGKVTIYAVNIPTGNIGVTINIIN